MNSTPTQEPEPPLPPPIPQRAPAFPGYGSRPSASDGSRDIQAIALGTGGGALGLLLGLVSGVIVIAAAGWALGDEADPNIRWAESILILGFGAMVLAAVAACSANPRASFESGAGRAVAGMMAVLIVNLLRGNRHFMLIALPGYCTLLVGAVAGATAGAALAIRWGKRPRPRPLPPPPFAPGPAPASNPAVLPAGGEGVNGVGLSSPRMLKALVTYGLFVNPALWLVNNLTCLAGSLVAGGGSAADWGSWILGLISLATALLMLTGGWKLRCRQASGIRLIRTGLWLDVTLIPTGLLIALLVALMAGSDEPQLPLAQWVLEWLLIVLFLSAFIFEIIALIWLGRHRESLDTILADSAHLPVPPLRFSRRAMIIAASGILCIPLLKVIIQLSGGPSEGPAMAGPGLRPEQLALAAPTLQGQWTSYHWGVQDDVQTWSGSTGVLRKEGDKLLLITNAHCLALPELAQSRILDLTVSAYHLKVIFPSGQHRYVLRFAEPDSSLDAALLEVDAQGLTEGEDYVVLPYGGHRTIQAGDEVVAVGTPLGRYAATQTFGRISAIRPINEEKAQFTLIQMDAAINPGNSGGPLLLRKNGRYHWVGINTWGIDQTQGLFFAIHARDAMQARYRWYSADKHGAVQALREVYRTEAQVK